MNLREEPTTTTSDVVVYVDDAGEPHDVVIFQAFDEGRWEGYWFEHDDTRVEVPAEIVKVLLTQLARNRLRRSAAAVDVGLYGEAP